MTTPSPGAAAAGTPATHARLGCRARCAECDAVGAGKRRCLLEMRRLLARHVLVERLVGPGEADGVVLEKHHALQVDLLDADLGGDLYERGQLGDGLLQA